MSVCGTWVFMGLGEILLEDFRDACEDKCNFLHSWNIGDCLSSLTPLEGHQKVLNWE